MDKNDVLIIRCDADAKIGIGHLMRCLALAQTWKKQGGRVIFLSNCNNSFLLQKIHILGFELMAIRNAHPHPDDLNRVMDLLNNIRIRVQSHKKEPWVVLDGYHFDSQYQHALYESNYHLLVVDDYNHQPNYFADIILNQNMGSEKITYHCPKKTSLLLGTSFIMLRDEFIRARSKRKQAISLKKIIISFGGSDPKNLTPKAIAALNQIEKTKFKIRVLLGPENKCASQVKEHASGSHHEFEFITSFDDMPSHFIWTDLAITAGGSTCWEMSYMGVPMLIIKTADNQKAIVDELSLYGAGIKISGADDFPQTQLITTIETILHDVQIIHRLSEKARLLVDGKGTQKIISKMIIGDIFLKPVKKDQKALLWEWVNESTVRQSAFNSGEINRQEHETWFRTVLNSEEVVQLIAFGKKHRPIGQIRFNFNGCFAETDYSIDKDFRGLGLGSTLLILGLNYLMKNHTGITTVAAKVKKDNQSSNKSLRNAGFTLVKERENYDIWQYLLKK